jgi:hypothetical protein
MIVMLISWLKNAVEVLWQHLREQLYKRRKAFLFGRRMRSNLAAEKLRLRLPRGN